MFFVVVQTEKKLFFLNTVIHLFWAYGLLFAIALATEKKCKQFAGSSISIDSLLTERQKNRKTEKNALERCCKNINRNYIDDFRLYALFQ